MSSHRSTAIDTPGSPSEPPVSMLPAAFFASSVMRSPSALATSLDRAETHLFFQFVSARYMKGSTIITSNRSVRDWVHIFAQDEMATTAILDRLFHKSHIFNIDGRSYRLRNFNVEIQSPKMEGS